MKRLFGSLFSINRASLTLCCTLLTAILFVIGIPILDLVELKTYDLRFISRGPLQPNAPVVLAVIDEKSLDTEGRWPWPRAKMGDLVERLQGDGAKVIGFDVGFLEPDTNTHLLFLKRLERKIDSLGIGHPELSRFLRESKIEAENDRVLANAIRNAQPHVVLGYFFHMDPGELEYSIDAEKIREQIARVAPSKYSLMIYEDQDSAPSPFVEAYAPEGMLQILAEAAGSAGYFNMFPDRDGSVRWMPLVIRCGPDTDLFRPLSLQCCWHYLDQPQLMVRVAGYGVRGIQMGEKLIPTNEAGQMLINYLGPPKTFPHYSASDILHGTLPEGTFKDKIVLVGATAVGLYDLRTTPFSSVYPGLEVHATVVDNILTGRFLAKPKWAGALDLLSILVMGLLAGLIISRLGALAGMLSAVGLFVLYLAFARWLFMSGPTWINIVYPLLALTLTYVVLTIYRYFAEERERKKIKGAFSRYVSTSVVNEILKHPEHLRLGGDKRDLTVLFSDIRGFTNISEGLTPEELVNLLNEYLTVMTNIVFKYDGTLDKYMGDAIMAIYGAPFEQENHPASACHSALEMMEELTKLNQRWISEGKPPLDIGIGINTGMMMVGNMGSDQLFDYTVMGDAVNLGSRLEGANKNYRTHILISESTFERVRDQFVCMEVDSVRVKGKTQPVKIFQLLAHKQVPPEKAHAVSYFEKGLALYKERRWEEAIENFNLVRDLDPDILVAALYVTRCQELKDKPPPPDWDGVFTMTTK
jgi:adenylate cyclase